MKDFTIIQLAKDDVTEIISVLCDAFFKYPVMQYVLKEENDYNERLKILINFFVMARILRQETILGVRNYSGLIAVALTSNNQKNQKIPELIQLRHKTWVLLGKDSKERYEKLGRIWSGFDTDLPNLHLNMLGVKENFQGTGIGRKLLEHLHHLSLNDKNFQGITLTTEDPQKVSFYEYMGYRITGYSKIENVLETWSFFRSDSMQKAPFPGPESI